MHELSNEELGDLIRAIRRYRMWLQTDADGDEEKIIARIKRLDKLEEKFRTLTCKK